MWATQLRCPSCGSALGRPSHARGPTFQCERCHSEHSWEELGLPDVLPVQAAAATYFVSAPANEAEQMAWFLGRRHSIASFQEGLVVLRPDYVAFLPTDRKRSALALYTPAALESLSRQVVPLEVPIARARERHLPFISGAWVEQRADFDELIRRRAEEAGGRVWRRADAAVCQWHPPTARHLETVAFRMGGTELHGKVYVSAAVGRILKNWRACPPPVRAYLLGAVALSLLPAPFTLLAVVGVLTASLPPEALAFWGGISLIFWGPVLLAWGSERRRWKRSERYRRGIQW